MLPNEVLTACTANAAAAIGEAGHRGAIAPGFAADLVILDTPRLEEWFYTPGRNRVRTVIKSGRVVHSALPEQRTSEQARG